MTDFEKQIDSVVKMKAFSSTLAKLEKVVFIKRLVGFRKHLREPRIRTFNALFNVDIFNDIEERAELFHIFLEIIQRIVSKFGMCNFMACKHLLLGFTKKVIRGQGNGTAFKVKKGSGSSIRVHHRKIFIRQQLAVSFHKFTAHSFTSC